MCISSVKVYNRARYIPLNLRYPYELTVPCGKCAECLSFKRSEWFYRIYREWSINQLNGGYVLFTTLTYDDEHLPHCKSELSKYKVDVPAAMPDYSCFSRDDIRHFFVRLRRYLVYHSPSVRYFCASEYGDDHIYNYKGVLRTATKRPHYHILFFVRPSLCVEDLHALICSSWKLGRVDPLRKFGNKANYFPNSAPCVGLCNYVAKYVTKSSKMTEELNRRVNQTMKHYIKEFVTVTDGTKLTVNPDDIFATCKIRYLDFYPNRLCKGVRYKLDEGCLSIVRSSKFRAFRRKLYNIVDEFHVESKGFGALAFENFSTKAVEELDFLTMPDKYKVVRKLPLFSYFRTKIFKERHAVNGAKFYEYTALGKRYAEKAFGRSLTRLEDKYRQSRLLGELDDSVSPAELADYVVNYRGRVIAPEFRVVNQSEVFRSGNEVYNYVCPNDVAHFTGAFVSNEVAHCGDYYFHDKLRCAIPANQFAARYLYRDEACENALKMIELFRYKRDKGIQAKFDFVEDCGSL